MHRTRFDGHLRESGERGNERSEGRGGHGYRKHAVERGGVRVHSSIICTPRKGKKKRGTTKRFPLGEEKGIVCP